MSILRSASIRKTVESGLCGDLLLAIELEESGDHSIIDTFKIGRFVKFSNKTFSLLLISAAKQWHLGLDR